MPALNAYEEGWEAYEEGKAENDYDEVLTKNQRREWRLGYKGAKAAAEREKEASQWIEFSSKCPWHQRGSGICKALRGEDDCECTNYNCAPLYFKEHNP